MIKLALKKIFLSFLFLLVGQAQIWASEEPKKETKEVAGEQKPVENYSGRQTQEWVELLNQLNGSKAKMEAQKKVVDELLLTKQKTTDVVKTQEVIKKLTEEHKKLNEYILEYESTRNKLRYRYPEKGIKELRVYERAETRSLNDYENSFSVEAKLTHAVEKMRKKYDRQSDSDKAKQEKIKIEKKNESIKKNPQVTDTIILIK